MKFKKICIVGYGSHTQKTIIPSLCLKKENIAIVSKKKFDNFCSFPNINIALKKLTKDYIFFISTPPKNHYLISRLILLSGFNVIIEKPLCLKVNQLDKLINIAKKKKLFIFENMMYFYSKQFKLFKQILSKGNIKEIDINFSIPKFNKNSFRTDNSLDSSILFDIGCYPFSLISYFNFNNNNYKISYKAKNKKLVYVNIIFFSKKIKFRIILSIFRKYKNYVKIKFLDNTSYRMDHFFYGKKIEKNIFINRLNKKKKFLKIKEENLFKKIFSFSKEKFVYLSKDQYFLIRNYLKDLNQIKKKIIL